MHNAGSSSRLVILCLNQLSLLLECEMGEILNLNCNQVDLRQGIPSGGFIIKSKQRKGFDSKWLQR